MKLHSIEAINLNSLYDDNAVDLDDRLEGTSLFLIYGPTGSGKSTLMDAVSLALFGKTPRLNAEHNNQAADPSAIMSRGTGECSATIVFSKLEGGRRQTYRARWTCKRAYGKPDGTVKAPVRSLERLKPEGDWRATADWDLVVSSHVIRAFTPDFEAVLEGFNVKDFNRSMLLAQGQFDAFLAAPAEERAEILERLTNTAVYQRIGERAARIHSRHSQKLKGLGTLAAAGGGLDPQALARLEKRHEGNAAELARRQQAHDQAAANLKWLDEDVTRRHGLAQARADQQVLLQDTEEANDGLAQLAAHERCDKAQAFRLADAWAAAELQVTDLEGQLAELDDALPTLEQGAQTARQAAQATAARAQQAADHLAGLRPLATAADEAAADHDRASKLASQTAASLAKADHQVDEARKALSQATAALAELRQQGAAAEADLEAHAADGKLAECWDALRTRLDHLVATSTSLARDTKTLAKRRTDLEGDRTKLDEDQKAHEAHREARLEPLQEVHRSAQDGLDAILAGADFEAARRPSAAAVELAKAHHDRVHEAQLPVAAALTGATELQETAEAMDALAATLAEAQGVLEGLAGELGQQQRLATQAQEAWERTELIAGLARHRAALEDGHECPLCGALEHPWLHDPDRVAQDGKLNELVDEAAAAHRNAHEASESAKAAHDQAQGTTRDLATKLELLQSQAREGAQKQAVLDQAATAALQAIPLPIDSTVAEVEEARVHAARDLKDAEGRLAALDQAQRLVSEAERNLRTAQDELKEADQALRDREAELKERGKQLEDDDVEHTQARNETTAEQAACRAALEDHGVTLEAEDPAAWRALGDQRRADHQGRVQAVADSKGQVEAAVETQKGAEKVLADRQEHQQSMAAQLKSEETERDRLLGLAEQARQQLDTAWQAIVAGDDTRPAECLPPADGTPAALVAAQELWVHHTNEAGGAATRAAHQAGKDLQANRTQHDTLAKQRRKRQDVRVAARSDLDSALEALELPHDDALSALRLSEQQRASLEEQRDALKRRDIAIKARIDEQLKLVAAHRKLRPATLPDDATREALAEAAAAAEQQLQDGAQAHQDSGDEIRAHQRAEQERADNLRRLREAEHEARVWKTLHDCIGRRNGGEFKQFAQALNLRQLLDKANVHLARLTKRYRLIPRLHEGLPTLDFDLSDLWQVGERVAPRSLSGGERFLVSLSLALGLSDFRTVKMPIETLLLDEGFGTLDPDTLNDALLALSQLQADGRQVGIISHVEGLKERVEARIEIKPLGGGRSKVQPPG